MLKAFQETGKNVILLPMGRSDDGAHSQVIIQFNRDAVHTALP